LAPTSGELIRPPSASIDLRHAAEEDNRARGCCTAATGHKSTLSLSERLQVRKGKPPVQHSRRRSCTKRSGTWKSSINKCKGRKRRWLGLLSFKGRLTKLLKKCVILLKMNKTEGPITGSFVRKAYLTKMDGMMILIMIPLLLMMLLPWQQNCRLSHGHNLTSHHNGHSDPKQFLMSYEATISSYGGNAAVMAKSFVMAVRNVAQTWYSSLRPRTITSWQKLKDMLVTSFQGFQMKPVTAQALFQCTQDHEEYLQVYVRRFLRLRAQAPTVPNEIVIEAMIKGLRPRPTTQYFARKPPQTLEKLLQKMDEYIQADNDFRQRREEAYKLSEMTWGFGGRIHLRHVRSIHNSTQNDDKGSQLQRPQYTSQSSGQQQSSFRPPAPRGRGARGFGGRYED
jgi:hypothetical protein